MVDGSRWKPILGAYQRGSAKEVLCLRPWSQDGWPSFWFSYIPCYSLLTYKPLLVHWASRVHYSLSILSPYISTPGLGPFSVCMHCLEASWALDLQVHLSLIIFSYYCATAFLHISLVVFFVSHSLFYLLVLLHILSTPSGDLPQFITWGIVTSFPLFIIRTLS